MWLLLDSEDAVPRGSTGKIDSSGCPCARERDGRTVDALSGARDR
ncbi:hypothetical protein ACTD5D_18970 [Nocardia takedensis]